VSVTSIGKAYDDELLAQLDDEALALLQGDIDFEDLDRRPKHFKGKGRAWKKEESDEDKEFTVAKKKAAKAAKAKAKSLTPTVGKKRGRPRKSLPTEDIKRDESDTDAVGKSGAASADVSPSPTPSRDVPKKTRKPPRKSVLSAEIVPDSDSDEDMAKDSSLLDSSALAASISSPAPTPKKQTASEQKSSPKEVAFQLNGKPPRTPKESVSPNRTPPSQSITLENVPKSLKLLLSMAKVAPETNGVNAASATTGTKPETIAQREDADEDEQLCK